MEEEKSENNEQERIFKLQRITIILLFGVFAALCILIWQTNLKDGNFAETSSTSNNITENQTAEVKVTDESAEVVTDEFTDWTNYTNKGVGYKLKYPTGWTLKEVDTTSEITGKDVKYITLTTSDKKYFLHFGLAPKGAEFSTTDRSGIGAGDFVKGENITILNTTFKADKLVSGNKVKEYFYPQGVKTTTDGNWTFTASFSATDKVNYDALDMTDLDARITAEQILSTIQIVE